MPNWCLNRLTIEHDDVTMIEEFVEAYKRGETCEHYIPTPKNADGSLHDDWWDYRVNNWGTKWDIGSYQDETFGLHPTVVDNQATMSFDSAWSPPTGLYERLVELGFKVEATYFEPGMGFAGRWIDGDDQYYETTDSWKQFPLDLIEEYNMDEFYEDEEETV